MIEPHPLKLGQLAGGAVCTRFSAGAEAVQFGGILTDEGLRRSEGLLGTLFAKSLGF